MSTAIPIIRNEGDGEKLWFAGGGVFTMKASAEDTGGAFVLFEDDVVRGKATPLHLHPNEDETIYVLEGELLVDMDGAQRRVGRHGVFVAPRGVPHAFLVTSETARLLCLQTPGTGESFYREASEPAISDADAARPADFARLREIAERSKSIELLGPPPFAADPHEPAVTAAASD
jgi:quercetin dioxygenase-like cupin family protein